MLRSKHFLTLVVIVSLFSLSMEAQPRRGASLAARGAAQQESVADTVKKSEPKGPALIDKFIKGDNKPMVGLTPVYKQDGRFYISINDSLFGRDIIMVTRISKSAEGIRSSFDGYAGDEINSALFQFDRGPENKIFLRKISGKDRSKDSTQAMYEAVKRSNVAAIVTTFDIKAESSDRSDHLIDVTDFFGSDSETLFFKKGTKGTFKLGSLSRESSYITQITTYPINTEVRTLKTYGRTDRGETATYELSNSFVLLPKTPMLSRYADDRVGYFTTGYTDFDMNPQGVKDIRMITRWRLEPRPQDIEKYKRGELVEPAKPIVYYIDPATPEEWVPYLIQGVNDWQAVFEKAGFKKAIVAKRAPTPEEDPEWSLEDARYSAIVYKPSDIANASGPHVHDPRSGEIIESHINWYHNVMSLLRNWYFIQCSPADPAARKMVFDTELMGQLIRFVSSHEVGHTLGLRHNFAGTAFYTVDQLRDPNFLRENGHTTSIMDYSRFNYVVQPEDNIPRELLFPRINHYDYWAIEWGYRRFYDLNDPVAEKGLLNKWIIEKTADRRFWFGTESSVNDPRMQAEDLGENQMEANQLGIKNLKFVMSNLEEWTKSPNEGYENLRTMVGEVNNQFRRYIGHVVKWVGGVYQESKTVEMPGDVYSYVEREKQIEAMEFLEKNLFNNPPVWLVPDNYLNKFPSRAESYIEKHYSAALSSMLSRRVLMNLTSAQTELGKKAFTAEEMFDRLNNSIWGGPNKSLDTYKRLLQKVYVHTLCDLYTGASAGGMMPVKPTNNPKDATECSAIAYMQITKLLQYLKSRRHVDFNTNAHYQYLIRRLEKTLSADQI